jgi:hypothetical protein
MTKEGKGTSKDARNIRRTIGLRERERDSCKERGEKEWRVVQTYSSQKRGNGRERKGQSAYVNAKREKEIKRSICRCT